MLVRAGRSPQAAETEADAIIARRKDEDDQRTDAPGAQRLGKPCGESFIPKTHECRTSGASSPTRASGAALGVAALAATAGTAALLNDPKMRQRVRVQTKLILRGTDKTLRQGVLLSGRGAIAGLSTRQVQEGLSKLPDALQGPARSLVGGAKKAAGAMALRAEGFEIQDIDVVSNFSTWKNKQGTLISVGSYGDSVVHYVSNNSHSWNKKRVYKVGFNVDQSFDAARRIPKEQSSAITAGVRKMSENHLAKINDGILATFPWAGDDYGAKRRAIYSRAGFNNLIGEESQWALVEKGRIKKLTSSQAFLFLAESGEDNAPIYKPSKTRKDANTGKRCGESYIPKSHECRKGGEKSKVLQTAARAALVAGAVAGGTALALRVRSNYAPSQGFDPSHGLNVNDSNFGRNHYELIRAKARPYTAAEMSEQILSIAGDPEVLQTNVRKCATWINARNIGLDPNALEKGFSPQSRNDVAGNARIAGVYSPGLDDRIWVRRRGNLDGWTSDAASAAVKGTKSTLDWVNERRNLRGLPDEDKQAIKALSFVMGGGMENRSGQDLITFIHEVGHSVHYRASKYSTAPIRTLVNGKLRTIDPKSAEFRYQLAEIRTGYGRTNLKEAFAEAHVAYVFAGRDLKMYAPLVHGWIDFMYDQAMQNHRNGKIK